MPEITPSDPLQSHHSLENRRLLAYWRGERAGRDSQLRALAWKKTLKRITSAYAIPGSHTPDLLTLNPDPQTLPTNLWKIWSNFATQIHGHAERYFDDWYSDQDTIRSREISGQQVFGNQVYHPELYRILPSKSPSILSFSLDLLWNGRKEWIWLGADFSRPQGLSTLVQGRRMQMQFYPELFEGKSIANIQDAPARLAEALRSQIQTEDNPMMGVLSDLSSGEHFFEDMFLARQMGVPLVTGEDLLVRNRAVYLKTIEGLQRIEVLFRRVPSEFLDPVALARSDRGVPGLLHCVRAGTVRLLNAPGTSILNHRSLLQPFIKRVSGLESNPTKVPFHWLADADLEAEISKKSDAWWRLPVDATSFRRERKEAPMALRVEPWMKEENLFRIRLFGFGSGGARLIPGGLVFDRPYDYLENPEWLFHNDVTTTRLLWVEEEKTKTKDSAATPLEPYFIPRRFSLGSRNAENLYWLGRYIERVDSMVRFLRIYLETRKEGSEDFGLLDQAINVFLPPKIKGRNQSAALRIWGQASSPGSILQTLDLIRRLNDSLRAILSPEIWQAIVQLAEESFPHRNRRLTTAEINRILPKIETVLRQITGIADRSLMRDNSWVFFRIGGAFERSLFTQQLIRGVLPNIFKNLKVHRRDDTELVTLLRIVSSLDAFHRVFRSRAFIDRILFLLYSSPIVPSSVWHCFDEIIEALQRLKDQNGRPVPIGHAPVQGMMEKLNSISWENMFPQRKEQNSRIEITKRQIKDCEKILENSYEETLNLHEFFETYFFNHDILEDKDSEGIKS